MADENSNKKKVNFSKQGKKNRDAGRRFEARVRTKLEEMGWIVDKWTNTVDYNREEGIGKVVPAKRKYNPFKKAMVIGTGFPDFICIRNTDGKWNVIGVEVKQNGYLDQIEKGMCYWLIDNKIFSRILIAKKGKKRGEIIYDDFSERYKRNRNN